MFISLFVAVFATCLLLALLSFSPAVQTRFPWVTKYKTYILFGTLTGFILGAGGYYIARGISASYMLPF